MATPGWLAEGAVLWDPEGERWVVRSVGPRWVEVGHADRGAHRLRRSDLVAWVEDDDWTG